MKANKLTEQGWLQTDGSLSTMQYGRKINNTTWEYKEVCKEYDSDEDALDDFENWREDIIDITSYSIYDIEQSVGHYGYSLNRDFILEQSGQTFSYEDSIQLICECIFELEF